jgi:phospholipid-binding lipoprotein MlaA
MPSPLRYPVVLLVALLGACLLAAAPSRADEPEAASAALPVEAIERASEAPLEYFNGHPLDPWEPANRRVYAFNRGFDRIAFLPVARGYQRITPPLVRRGVSNFFDNLVLPVSALNMLLQGRPRHAAAALGRFTINATLGIGGVLDPATEFGIARRNADFGQTFARWGWKESRYMVLPVFGPSTARDTWGKGINSQVNPVSELARREGAQYSVLYGIDARSRGLSAEAMLAGAADEYALVRDAYLQYRRCQIIDCSEELPEYLLPDFEFEIPDFESLRR